MANADADLMDATLVSLWDQDPDPDLDALLPRSVTAFRRFPEALDAYLNRVPRRVQGLVDPAVIVRGDIVSMGEGSVIEAGAILHESCRLVLGAGSRIRSGAVLRGPVIVGEGCLIGVHCEIWRTIILGPGTTVAPGNFLGDSIIGRGALVSGNVIVANHTMRPDRTVTLRRGAAGLDSGRSHLGALIGDGAKLGMSTHLCPGAIVMKGLSIPPGMVLYGTIDSARRQALVDRFFREWGE